TMIERAPRFREGGYMIDFWGEGFDVAENMGLLPRLNEVGYRFNRIKFVDANGRTRSEFGERAFRNALGERFISLQRGDLARAIFDTIAENIDIIFDESITEIHEDPSGLDVSFERSAPRRFDLVVGCDGLHSAVRRIIFGGAQRFEKFLGYYAASFVTGDYPHREELTYVSYGAPGRQISRYALRGNRSAFLFVFSRDRVFPKHPHEDAAKQIVRKIFSNDQWVEVPKILERMDTCDEFYFDSVSQIRMPSWSHGRTALVGDAAYCPSLLAGEGAAFAMAGAYVLSGELYRANGDYDQAFKAYEKRLRGFIESKQGSAKRFAASFAPATLFGLAVRDLVLRTADCFLPLGKWLIRKMVGESFDLPDYDVNKAVKSRHLSSSELTRFSQYDGEST
ncbi:MAG TPA: FAD-dependent monooxygenase, partial [Candidatus Udaeobacter sp.]|nr:FAD-dependent monooxygenase [Candidatus Udaeobacter sp.]